MVTACCAEKGVAGAALALVSNLVASGDMPMDAPPQKRFPALLKDMRLKRRWKQEALATNLHVRKRPVISWEAGERLPSVGMVVLLSLLLEENWHPEELARNQLLCAYVIDDLVHQAEAQHDEQFRELALRTAQLLSLSSAGSQSGQENKESRVPLEQMMPDSLRFQKQEHQVLEQDAESKPLLGDRLQQLFALLKILQEHPELIPTVQDFLQEVALRA